MTLRGVMAIVAFHARMFGVIEICSHHPSIDQNRFRDYWRGVRHRFHFVAKGAAVKRTTCRRIILTLRFVGIGGEENLTFEVFPGADALAQLRNLDRKSTRLNSS